MKSAKEVLTKARRLLAKRERWAKGYYAFDKNGDFTGPTADNAVKWCAEGACLKFAGLGEFGEHRSIELLREQIGEIGIADWNDRRSRTHKQVLALFDKAIAAA